MRAQAQMIDRLGREMRDMVARNLSQPQFAPMPQQPPIQAPGGQAYPTYQPPPPPPVPFPGDREGRAAAPPAQAGAGIPRFARDSVEEELADVPVSEAVAETAGLQPSVERGVPGLQPQPEDLPGAEEKPGEAKKDLRQRLRDFLKRIRNRLDQRRTKEELAVQSPGAAPAGPAAPGVKPPGLPLPRAKGPKKSKAGRGKGGRAPDSKPGEGSASLVNYLEELTEYLPEKRKSGFRHSDARLKIEYIKSKLQGRSGIKYQIESKFAPPLRDAGQSTVDRGESASAFDRGEIAETFDFMKNLASYHPDKTLATMLQSKLNAVLHKIRE
jgi:hypothetical protein